MKYTDEEIEKAYKVIESAKNTEVTMQKSPVLPEWVHVFFKQLSDISPFEHIQVFTAVKLFTAERLMSDMKAFENQYMELKEKVNHIEEFLKTKLV